MALAFSGISILEQTPAILRSLLANATRDDLDWQPSPDRWSISMVLAHLADVEGKGFVSRFRAPGRTTRSCRLMTRRRSLFPAKSLTVSLSLSVSRASGGRLWFCSNLYPIPCSYVPRVTRNWGSSVSASCSTNSYSTIWATSAR
ncbi:MAG: DinB family protein [Acidobacteriaceae bacterium]|nr:DinB family protein [Acidobacteriaceae bacterium]MBV9778518.1 DinB family protein [Acidobacteriaceae bacterium]